MSQHKWRATHHDEPRTNDRETTLVLNVGMLTAHRYPFLVLHAQNHLPL